MKVTDILSLTAASIAVFILGQTPAIGQSAPCGQRDQVVGQLTQKYGETRRSIAMAHNNSVVEVYASDDTGTWTITVTSAHGVTCLMASGQSYESIAALPSNPRPDA
ncbi:MAG: hypothetical protein ACWA40_06855 [Planktomarina sp.]